MSRSVPISVRRVLPVDAPPSETEAAVELQIGDETVSLTATEALFVAHKLVGIALIEADEKLSRRHTSFANEIDSDGEIEAGLARKGLALAVVLATGKRPIRFLFGDCNLGLSPQEANDFGRSIASVTAHGVTENLATFDRRN